MKGLIPVFSLACLAAIAATATKPDVPVADLYWKVIRSNDLTALRALIRKDGVKATDPNGNTPLMVAAADGSLDSMRILLKAGADPNATNVLKATPLLWCAGDAAKVKLLLANGAHVNAKSKLGHTALQLAASFDGNIESAQTLVSHGADVNAEDAGGASVLESAAGSNNLAVAKLLLAHGAHVNHIDKSKQTALTAAAGNGCLSGDMVKMLIRKGAWANVTSVNMAAGAVLNGPVAVGHFTALHLSAELSEEATRAELNAGAVVDAKDVRGATPLTFAVATDHPVLPAIKLLLEHGANPAPALVWAKRYNNPAVLSLLGSTAVDPSSAPISGSEATLTDELMREAVRKSLACSQPAAVKFRKAGGCVSCHSQIATGLAVTAAKPLAVPADYEMEYRQAQHTAKECGQMQELAMELQDPGGGSHTMSNYLLHLQSAKIGPSMDTDAMIHFICGFQRKEGDWPNGSYPRPPMEEGSFTLTAEAIHALRMYPVPALKAEIDRRVHLACAYLSRTAPTTTEDRCMQVLGLYWAGKTPLAATVQALISAQRPDGGWGQTDNLPTDAYATGEVLLALHAAGVTKSEPVYQRGAAYLVSSQDKSGAWHVKTRSLAFQPYFQSGFPFDHDQWISQQGTAYAALALEDALAR